MFLLGVFVGCNVWETPPLIPHHELIWQTRLKLGNGFLQIAHYRLSLSSVRGGALRQSAVESTMTDPTEALTIITRIRGQLTRLEKENSPETDQAIADILNSLTELESALVSG